MYKYNKNIVPGAETVKIKSVGTVDASQERVDFHQSFRHMSMSPSKNNQSLLYIDI